MNESLFGATPQLWPTIPVANPYFQAAPGNRVFSGGPILANPSLTDAGQAATLSAAPVLMMPDVSITPTPQALLTAVAMRRGQPMGPTNDQEIEDFISDALDLLPGATDVEIRCEGGRATLTGTVSHKRLKRDVGEIVWAIPSVNDVQNNVTIATRRRSRPTGRESETPVVAGASRKQT
ncbi:MAG: BON domain-containing protein [Vicinamibacterales bacterium]